MSSDEYNGDQLIIVCVIFLGLTYTSVGLRCFVRIKLINSFQSDDWLMLVAQFIFSLSCSFILRGVHYGLGRHNASLAQNNEIQALKYQALATLTYVANMMFIKLSICGLLLRIAIKKHYVWTLRISMVIVAIWSVAIFLYDIFQCQPVEAQWDFTIKGAKCVGTESIVSAAYAISVMTILSDWLYALLPIPMIWNVNMSPQAKFTVGVVLSLGIFASVATLIRLAFLSDLANADDILFAGTNPMIWTLVEPGVAIVAASLITIRPLLRAFNLNGFAGTTRTPGVGSHPLSLRSDLPSNNWNSTAYSSRAQKFDRMDDDEAFVGTGGPKKTATVKSRAISNCSQEQILGDNEIQRTIDITVSSRHREDDRP